MLVQLQEDPLGPLVVLGVGGGDLAIPVKGEAQRLELLTEVIHILFGDDGRVDVVLHGKVLGGHPNIIQTNGVQHVVAVLAALAADHIQGSIAAGVAHMQARTRGIRELHQCIELGLFVVDLDMEGLFVLPHLLPLGLNGLVIILHSFQSLLIFGSLPCRQGSLQTVFRGQI